MTEASLQLDTVLGPFRFLAECDNRAGEVSLDLTTVEPRLSLPEGMSVLRCRAVVLRVAARVDVAGLHWSCEAPPGVAGSPRSGEHLAAEEWESGDRLVVAGTEDDDVLTARLWFLRLGPDESVIWYSPEKLELKVPRVPASASFGLHFIIAENEAPEPVDSSAWFAVDIPHEHLAAPVSD